MHNVDQRERPPSAARAGPPRGARGRQERGRRGPRAPGQGAASLPGRPGPPAGRPRRGEPARGSRKRVHYTCNIAVLNGTVLYYFCVIKCSPNYSNFTKKIVIMFFSPVGYGKERCCIPKAHRLSKTFCSLYTVLQSVYCTISKLLNKYKNIYIILYNFPKMWYSSVGF